MQQQLSGGAPPPSSFQIASIVVTWIISIIALGVASYSLYLQRKDKKPRLDLRVETGTETLELGNRDEEGFATTEEAEVLIIHAANPTDKPINIDSIQFQPKGHARIHLPFYQSISTIPPHEKRLAMVVLPQLRQKLEVVHKGHFILIDALGNHHNTKPMVI